MDDSDINKDRLALALEAAGLDLWENDLVSGAVSRKAIKVLSDLGYGEEEMHAYVDDLFSIIHPEDIPALRAEVERHFAGATAQYRSEFRIRAKSGGWVWHANYGKIMDRQGSRFIGVTFNIDDRKKKEFELEEVNRKLAEQNAQLENMNAALHTLATSDPLTGLPNRRYFLDKLQNALDSRKRTGHTGALLFIDIDNFKTLNDTLGHDIGDLLLQKVAKRLKSCVREVDTVARIGGDEFVIMLEELSDSPLKAAAETEYVGKKILASFTHPYKLDAHEFVVSPSIGATIFSEDAQTTNELMRQTDIAMYQAKKAGRNTLRFFNPKMQELVNARASLECGLRKALENREFMLHYQVLVDRSFSPIGAEALVRWQHPEHGLLLPAQFIPMAEKTGLILSLGLWILETVCAQLRHWQKDERTRSLVLSVNVSAKQFRQPDFVPQVRAIVNRHGIDPSRLRMELAESMLLENAQETIDTVNALKETGIRFSLDDFGSGYSSLQYLERLPLDHLSIGRAFMQRDRTIARAIVALARSMAFGVIAEGVETPEQLEFAHDNQCDAVQGFLTGRPVSIDDLTIMLEKALPLQVAGMLKNKC